LVKVADERPSAEAALALEVLAPYAGAAGGSVDEGSLVEPSAREADQQGLSAAPPPPPPPLPLVLIHGGEAPLPPPSPVHSSNSPASRAMALAGGGDLGDTSLLASGTLSGTFLSQAPSAVPHDGTPPLLGSSAGSAPVIDALPPLRRPAPPGTPASPSAAAAAQGGQPPFSLPEIQTELASPRPRSSPSPSPPLGSPLEEASFTQAAPSPSRPGTGLAAAAAPVMTMARSLAQWTEAGHEAQVLLVRARGALLRRPRARGNWVMAFARHDTTGQGFLDCSQFQKVLSSLSLGMSAQEIALLANSLAGPGMPGVSLGAFSEAITHAQPSDYRFGEQWALETAGALAGDPAGGLAALAGRSAQQALAGLPPPEPELGLGAAEVANKLLLWLPKTADGGVDWPAAEEWRVGAPA